MNERDGAGSTPMHIACQEAHLNVVEYLVEHGGNVNERDDDGKAPRDWISSSYCNYEKLD